MINKIQKIIIFSLIFVVVGFWLSPVKAFASTVEFSNTPLFGQSNFAPGNSISDRFIKINNETADSHRAIIQALDVVNSGGLGDMTNIQIKNGSDIYFDGTFTKFFSEPEIVLPQIGPGESKTFYLIVTFNDSAGNGYQNSTMSFSIKAGLDDGDTTTDTTTIVDGSSGSGGGGGGGRPIILGSEHLVISNENSTVHILPAPQVGDTINVTWDTNISATSQVVYGLTSNGPYVLNMSSPNFGYPFITIEQDLDPNKVTSHNVVLSNLLPGEYTYRVISRASPPTVGYEYHFTVPTISNNNLFTTNTNTNINKNIGQNLGGQTTNTGGGGTITSNNNGSQNQKEQNGSVLGASAANIFGLSNSLLYYILIFLLLLLILLLILLRRKKKKKEGIK